VEPDERLDELAREWRSVPAFSAVTITGVIAHTISERLDELGRLTDAYLDERERAARVDAAARILVRRVTDFIGIVKTHDSVIAAADDLLYELNARRRS